MRRAYAGAVMATVWLATMATASAEGRPLKQLPADVARWSMSWTEVPKQMVEVGQEYGPIAAVTWGPVQGAASLIGSTTKELWDIMKADKQARRSASAPRRSTGSALVRYEF